MDPSSRTPSCLRTVLLFALTGFLAGFVGPIILNPGANQGPLLGLFITGPLGTLLGALACVLQRLLPGVTPGLLRSVAAVFALVTLYFCLPGPALVGQVIEARVLDCAPPGPLSAAALARWEAALARTPAARPRPDWRQAALSSVAHFDAAVLTLDITRSSAIYERRKPWDRGTRFAGPWIIAARPGTYYVRDAVGACANYLAGQSGAYWPVPGDGMPAPGAPWPPVDAAGFLSLQELGAVPPEVSALLAAR